MTQTPTPVRNPGPRSTALRVSVRVVQILLAVTFLGTGVWKLLTPIPQLAAMIPWAGQVPRVFLQSIAVVDLCGGIGILLPSVTGIQPRLTPLAALGCAALQVCAIVFHLMRGEAANTPFNVLLVGLSVFVYWGTRAATPEAPVAE